MDFIFTTDQMKKVCEHFGKNIDELEDYEVAELLDRVIDELD